MHFVRCTTLLVQAVACCYVPAFISEADRNRWTIQNWVPQTYYRHSVLDTSLHVASCLLLYLKQLKADIWLRLIWI